MQKFILLTLLAFSTSVFAQRIEFVADINPNGDARFEEFIEFNEKIYFTAGINFGSEKLWMTDGTPEGTAEVKAINPNGEAWISNLFVYNNKFLFTASDGVHHEALWVSDGTEKGTKLLKDIYPGGLPRPRRFIEYNGQIYFTANDGRHGFELWVTNGTKRGTKLLKDISPAGLTIFGELVRFKDQLYFTIFSEVFGTELWTTDGSWAGTRKVKNFCLDASRRRDAAPKLIVAEDKLFFEVDDCEHGFELWASDGTEEGTVLVKDINLRNSKEKFGHIRHITAFGNKVYFMALDGVTRKRKIWYSDGTAEGTALLMDEIIRERTDFVKFQDKLYFNVSKDTPDTSPELWTTDGTPTGTKVFDFEDIHAIGLIPCKDKLYFQIPNPSSYHLELWVTDGTFEGTTMVKDFNPLGHDNPSDFKVVDDRLYLTALDNFTTGDSSIYHAVWVTDGTEKGTKKLVPEHVSSSTNRIGIRLYEPEKRYFGGFNPLGNAVYFAANYDNRGWELWRIVPDE